MVILVSKYLTILYILKKPVILVSNIEINLIKIKWLFCGCYHPPSLSDQYFFKNIGKTLDKYSKHDKFMLVGISTLTNQNHTYHNSFMNTNAKNIVKENILF